MDKNKTRLEEYIKSNGKRVPRDFRDYDSTQKRDKSHLCVFCTTIEHDNIFLFSRDVNGKLSNTFSSICSDCSMQIDMTMVDTQEEEHYTGFPISGGGWNDDYDDHKAMSSDDSAWANHVPLKLLEFMNQAKYDEDVYSWLLELDGRKFTYAKERSDTYCYFCDERTEGIATMFVPVDSGNKLSGGNIRVCASCQKTLNEQFVDVPFATELCAHCDRPYYITYEEKNQRVENNAEGLHLCPPCIYKQLEYEYTPQSNISRVSGVAFARFPYAKPPERHTTYDCKVCSRPVKFDLTVIASVYEEYNFLEGLLCCTNCKSAQEHVIAYGKDYLILVSKETLEQGNYFTVTLLLREDHDNMFGAYVEKGFDPIQIISKFPHLHDRHT